MFDNLGVLLLVGFKLERGSETIGTVYAAITDRFGWYMITGYSICLV